MNREEIEADVPKTVFVCPRCGAVGFPSVYGDFCTKCANEIRRAPDYKGRDPIKVNDVPTK